MAETTRENTSRTENQTTNSSANQSNTSSNQGSGTSQQSQSQTGNKSSWVLPGLQQTYARVTNELNSAKVPAYQYAGLNDTEKAALNVLAQGRDMAQVKDLLGKYQAQASTFTDYGAQATEINDLASKLYQSDLVNQNKSALAGDLDKQAGEATNRLNQQAIGTGNMASSRAGVAEGAVQRSKSEAYAKGAADIENNARSSAYTQANNIYQQGQSNLFQSLGQQSNIASTLANAPMQDAQSAFTSGQQTQKDLQNTYDLNRKNAEMANSPGYAALTEFLPGLTALGQFGTVSSGTATGQTSESSNSTGQTNTSGNQVTNLSGTTTSAGDSTGPATNWSGIGAGLAGQAAGFALQPVAETAGKAAVAGMQKIWDWL